VWKSSFSDQWRQSHCSSWRFNWNIMDSCGMFFVFSSSVKEFQSRIKWYLRIAWLCRNSSSRRAKHENLPKNTHTSEWWYPARRRTCLISSYISLSMTACDVRRTFVPPFSTAASRYICRSQH
jgi:hypothetical protein